MPTNDRQYLCNPRHHLTHAHNLLRRNQHSTPCRSPRQQTLRLDPRIHRHPCDFQKLRRLTYAQNQFLRKSWPVGRRYGVHTLPTTQRSTIRLLRRVEPAAARNTFPIPAATPVPTSHRYRFINRQRVIRSPTRKPWRLLRTRI